MTSRINVIVPPSVEASVRAQVEEAIQDDALLREVGEIAKKDIQATILTAKTPATGERFAAPTITKNWQKRKKALSKTNAAFDSQSGGGSILARLIFTGTWLQSFTARIIKTGSRKQIEIGPEGMHPPYTGVRGAPLGEPISNQTLGRYLIEQGRDWRGVTPRTKDRIVNVARSFIRRKLQRKGTK